MNDRAEAVPAVAREEIEAALSTFRQWLLECEHAREEFTAVDAAGDDAVRVDTSLLGLIAQWGQVREEIQRQADAGKSTRDEIDSALTSLRSGAEEVQKTVAEGVSHTVEGSFKDLLSPLVKDRDRLRENMRHRLQNAEHNWLELLLDLREAIDNTTKSTRTAAGNLGWRKFFVPKSLSNDLVQTFETALHRVDGALESRDVRPIDCVGKPVDPQCMRVVDTVPHDDLPDGHVAEIVREGYTIGEEIVRFAEVKAVKS